MGRAYQTVLIFLFYLQMNKNYYTGLKVFV